MVEKITQTHSECRAKSSEPTVVSKDLLINATPVGMASGDGLPIGVNSFDARLFVADIVPSPEVTPLLAAARNSGCRTMDGAAMVTGQTDAILRFFGLV